MTNKELEVIVCNAIDARKEQGTPFDRDAFAAPNRRQKLFLAEHGLKSENWKIEKETPEYLYIVSKNGQHRLLNKN